MPAETLKRILPFVLFGAAVALVLMAASCTDDAPGPPGERGLAVWSEFMTDVEVRATLPLLADEGADLYLAIPTARIGEPGLAALLRDAAAAGVGVRAWILLADEDGYWPNEHNVEAMRAATTAFLDWRDAEQLEVQWLIFDMEMSLQRTEEAAAVLDSEGTLAALSLIKEGRDPEAFAENHARYVELVEDLQARGAKIMAVTYPTVLDDLGDGDPDIQDQMDVPIVGVPWDQVSFMVYQSLIYDLTGSWHGPDIVHSYAVDAKLEFGERAAVALGIVGTAGIGGVDESYPDAPALLADHAAVRAAGIDAVSVYSLDGLMESGEPDEWLDRRVAPVEPVLVDADYWRNLIRALLDGE
jgi:hypothetical protein